MYAASVIRTPYASNTLVQTLDGLRDLLQLLPTGISQQLRFLQDLFLLQIPDTYCFLSPVDVMSDDDWMFPWSWRDYHFDLRVRSCEFC
jgi:hypothetical protein